MARRKTKTLTEVELEFMRVIWSEGRVSTEDVQAALRKKGRPLSDGSVRKMLSILVRKEYLSRRRDGRGFIYTAKVPEDRANRSMVQDLLTRAFSGSASLMVAALIDSRNVSRKDISEIKRLISGREKEGHK